MRPVDTLFGRFGHIRTHYFCRFSASFLSGQWTLWTHWTLFSRIAEIYMRNNVLRETYTYNSVYEKKVSNVSKVSTAIEWGASGAKKLCPGMCPNVSKVSWLGKVGA